MRRIPTRDFCRRRADHAPAGAVRAGHSRRQRRLRRWTVPTAYDPLVSKVIAWAPDRPGAIARMVRALTEYDLRGISTTIGFCRELIESPAFAAAEFDTTYVDRLLEQDGGRGATRRRDGRDRGHRGGDCRVSAISRASDRDPSESADASDDRSATISVGATRAAGGAAVNVDVDGERPPVEGRARAGRAAGTVHA